MPRPLKRDMYEPACSDLMLTASRGITFAGALKAIKSFWLTLAGEASFNILVRNII